jgi:hypothetical protein
LLLIWEIFLGHSIGGNIKNNEMALFYGATWALFMPRKAVGQRNFNARFSPFVIFEIIRLVFVGRSAKQVGCLCERSNLSLRFYEFKYSICKILLFYTCVCISL